MQIDENKTALAAALLAVAGIALLFLLSETAEKTSVAQALVAQPNSRLEIAGTAANVTAEKFQLCDRVCISVRSQGLPSASLLSNGRMASVKGRLKEYKGSKYVVADTIEVK